MNQDDDENNGFGESDIDPEVRELRLQIVRLEAQLDQLLASVRERAQEAAEIQAKLAALEESMERLKARRRRDEKILVAVWVMMLISLGMSGYSMLHEFLR